MKCWTPALDLIASHLALESPGARPSKVLERHRTVEKSPEKTSGVFYSFNPGMRGQE